MAVRSKKPRAVALVKWLAKKGVEKIQKEHRLAIAVRDNQIQALEFTNEEHQQEILRLNEEIDDTDTQPTVDVLTTCYVSSKITAKRLTHTTLFDVSLGSLKNIIDGLTFVTQKWRWLINAMIQTRFTDGVDLSVK